MRHTAQHIAAWRDDGAVLVPNFFSAEEIAPVQADFERLYGRGKDGQEAASLKPPKGLGNFSPAQFTEVHDFPLAASVATNLIGLHPDLIAFAKQALGCDDVRLYQCHSWAKFTGDADYEQPFHCDFSNHTLTVPADDHAEGTINFVIYFTEVSDDLGAIHYVPHRLSDPLTGQDRASFIADQPELQETLKQVELSGAGPIGSVFAYGIDVYHRGTNLTRPGGYRYTMTASYKRAGNDMIGFSAWPQSFLKPWALVFANASPEQLACLGVPRPGDPFWTERTLRRAQERWPDWDMTPYRKALSLSA